MMDLSRRLEASGIITTGPGELTGFLLGMDGVNDVTDLAIYNGQDNGGEEVIPTCDYEADYRGLNGVVGIRRDCADGMYLEFTCAGAAEVVVFYRAK